MGVIFDKKLTFNAHTEYIRSTALRALSKVGALFNRASVEASLTMYIVKVRPHLERTYPLWRASSRVEQNKVTRVHRLALLRASGAFISAAMDVLEILLCIIPIQLLMCRVPYNRPDHSR